jgi:hypothetical protein
VSAIAASGARARPTGSLLLSAFLDFAACSLVLTSPWLLSRHTAALVASWFSGSWLALLRPSGLPLPSPLPLSLVVREREGGRRYPFYIPRYRGPRVVGEAAYRAASATAPRVLLSAIPRIDRHCFPAPPGRRYVLADIDRCFPVLLATVAQDEELLAAARSDLHQEAGDTLAPRLPAAERRRLGKRFNNAVIGLITPNGWQRHLRGAGILTTLAEAQAMHDRWWARFARARAFRDAWLEMHASAAAANRPLRIVYPDGRPYSFDAATVRGVARRPRWAHLVEPQARLDASARTTFSAIWRGVEGLVLDEALHRLYELRGQGLRLVLPLYDGLLLEAPDGSTDLLCAHVADAVGAALRAVGVPAGVTVNASTTWAGGCTV